MRGFDREASDLVMCGIAAFFSPERPVLASALERATAVLHHRGPDARRQWVDAGSRVGLGHARLSIIDLGGGDQPIANEESSLRVVVNGEFYGFEEIRSGLEQRGHCFRTRSDSEIVLHLYEELGAQCLHHLRGEFALVLWDAANRTLFAARDRFGIKPLFYAVHEGTLHLASEVKALFAAGVPARWDSESFHDQATGAPMPDRTLYQGVYQIPPGHYLLATRGGMRVLKYWDFDYETAAELAGRSLSERDCIEEFSAALDEAVRLRLRADVPVGCYLSGGLDSCAVLGFAARHAREPIQAFTLTFDQAAYDEGGIAREMAEKAGAVFHPVPIHQSDLADHFSDAVWHAETLFLNGHGISKYLLSRTVRDAGFKVVYTGEGSDEILGGYAHFRRDMVLHNAEGQDPAEVGRLLEALNEGNAVSRGMLLPDGQGGVPDQVRRTLGFVPSWFEVFSAMADKRRSLFSDEFASEFGGRVSVSAFLNQFDIAGQLRGRDPLNQALYLWSKSALSQYILVVLGDRMEMAHSIEGRVPFLDHHVVECLTRMPISLKIRGMTEKYVLREAARPVLTDTVYRRQKHPFLSPPVTGLPSERFHTLLQDTLRGPALASLPFYDARRVKALLDRLPSMSDADRVAWDPVLMTVLSACILQQRLGL